MLVMVFMAVVVMVPMPMPVMMVVAVLVAVMAEAVAAVLLARVLAEDQGFDGHRHRVRRHADAAEVDVIEVP